MKKQIMLTIISFFGLLVQSIKENELQVIKYYSRFKTAKEGDHKLRLKNIQLGRINEEKLCFLLQLSKANYLNGKLFSPFCYWLIS